MGFDVEGARKAGYSDAEIAEHLAQTSGFDLAGSKKAKYSDSEVIAHLASAAALPAPRPGIVDRVKAIPGQIVESITGTQRATDETQALPDWAGMPELNSFSLAGAKTGLGTLLSNPAETVQIIQANFPGVQVRQDEKGNFLLRSSMDGQEYAIKPGFSVSDIPRAAGAVAAFTPAGRAASLGGMALGAGGTQAIIEGSQALAGGEFNPGEIATAAALAPVLPVLGRAAGAVAAPVKQAVNRVLGRAETALPVPAEPAIAPPGATPPAAAPVPAPLPPAAAAAAAPAEMGVNELAQTAKKAAGGGIGSKSATEALAAQAAPDAKTLEAAKRLGIDEYLQPDHVTTSQTYRELAQAVKSIPGSEARAAELQGLEKVGQRAEKLIEDIGGTNDASTVSHDVRQAQLAQIDNLGSQEAALYGKVRNGLPPRTPAPADNALALIEQRAKDLGGAENLSPMEKTVLKRLSPKEDGTPPTYALLDDVRKDVGAVTARGGPFADADVGLAKLIYGKLAQDQLAVAEASGQKWNYLAAQYATRLRKGIEDDMASLFGKQIDKSLAPAMSGAVRGLAQGDASRLTKLLQAVPQGMRQEVAASGLATAFRTAGTRGPISFPVFAKWYEGLMRNKQAHAALMTNLPPAARKQISDLYRVSQGISAASRERITTGRIQAVQEQFKAADSLAGQLYDAAKRGAVGATVGTAAGAVLGPGVGAAIASALTRGAKPAADKAVDALISSPAFIQAAKQVGQPGQTAAVRALAYSKPFTKFVRAVGSPREMSNRERWILNAMQARNNLDDRQ